MHAIKFSSIKGEHWDHVLQTRCNVTVCSIMEVISMLMKLEMKWDSKNLLNQWNVLMSHIHLHIAQTGCTIAITALLISQVSASELHVSRKQTLDCIFFLCCSMQLYFTLVSNKRQKETADILIGSSRKWGTDMLHRKQDLWKEFNRNWPYTLFINVAASGSDM